MDIELARKSDYADMLVLFDILDKINALPKSSSVDLAWWGEVCKDLNRPVNIGPLNYEETSVKKEVIIPALISRINKHASIMELYDGGREWVENLWGTRKFYRGITKTKSILISIAMDGDSVCTLIGSDLQVGIAGFGTTIAESIDNFCSAWQNASRAEREDAIKSVLGTIPPDRLNAALSRSI